MHKSKNNSSLLISSTVCVLLVCLTVGLTIIVNRNERPAAHGENGGAVLENDTGAALLTSAVTSFHDTDGPTAADPAATDAPGETSASPETTEAPVETTDFIQEVLDPDLADLTLSYQKLTAPPSPAMVHNTEANSLETHGSFAGCEAALSELEKLLSGFEGSISLIAYSLDGSRSVCYNSDLRYEPQCTVKAAYVFSICQYMDSVGFDAETQIVYRRKNEYPGSGTVQDSPFGTKFTVRDLIMRTLTISDNAAYSMLCDYFGLDVRNKYMDKIGCHSFVSNYMWGSRVEPADFVTLWTEIYSYLCSGTKYAELMKAACTDTLYSYAKPTGELHYSHKSGDGFDWKDCHDACLVWDDVPYILVIFTHADEPGASHPTIEDAAKIVHEKLF